MSETFKPGDIVRFKGGQDEWTIAASHLGWTVTITSSAVTSVQVDATHLELVRRSKRKETRTIERWVNVYEDGDAFVRKESKEAADNGMMEGRIACVRLTGTYDVEVDDE